MTLINVINIYFCKIAKVFPMFSHLFTTTRVYTLLSNIPFTTTVYLEHLRAHENILI